MTRTRGLLAAVLVTAAVLGSNVARATSGDPTCPTYNPPTELVLAAGTPQSAQLGTPFRTPFRVALAAANGCPMTTPLSGVAVTFVAPDAGPSGIFSDSGTNAVLVGTDDSGTATAPMFTANTSPGGYLVTASSAMGSVVFSVVNTASGVPATITALSPARQSAVVGAHYPKPLSVAVADSSGKPVAGVSVSFALGAGASFDGGGAQAQQLTDASGIATSPSFVAGQVAGTFTATATVAGLSAPVRFTLDDLAAKPPRLSIVGGRTSSAAVGGRYGRPLEVKVRDGAGRPMAGATVSFSLDAGTPAASGGSGSTAGATFVGGAAQATATSNARGIATSPRLTANSTAGTFDATATLTSGGTAVFSLRNRPGRPQALAAGAAASESTTVGTRFPIPLAVTVTDKYGNPVAGVAVTFSAPRRGAGARFAGNHVTATAKTDSKGIAIAPALVAGRTAGGYVVRATAAGHSAAFGLMNEPAGG
jgi:protocatechuate 3,4-dioxygenase beta subunit